jgi:hypothetical protein
VKYYSIKDRDNLSSHTNAMWFSHHKKAAAAEKRDSGGYHIFFALSVDSSCLVAVTIKYHGVKRR